ncbi:MULTISPECIES: hypothetical protein [unclassified Novosphingobium]|uniref:hypothetical protein n=1 Tax=unclassified Novosphingobium TaxID=2644732 RepID=UPI001F46C792|nr:MULTISPECIES: hypothetical protein [unclassified Novosphingobium]
MCNLYRMNAKDAEVAKLFGNAFTPGANFAAEVWPGYPSLVIEGGTLPATSWGLPRRAVSKKTGKPLKPSPSTMPATTTYGAMLSGGTASAIGAA